MNNLPVLLGLATGMNSASNRNNSDRQIAAMREENAKLLAAWRGVPYVEPENQRDFTIPWRGQPMKSSDWTPGCVLVAVVLGIIMLGGLILGGL